MWHSWLAAYKRDNCTRKLRPKAYANIRKKSDTIYKLHASLEYERRIDFGLKWRVIAKFLGSPRLLFLFMWISSFRNRQVIFATWYLRTLYRVTTNNFFVLFKGAIWCRALLTGMINCLQWLSLFPRYVYRIQRSITSQLIRIMLLKSWWQWHAE